jgi:hypothetical protein
MLAAGNDKTKEKIMRREGCVFTKGDVDALVPEGKIRAEKFQKNYMLYQTESGKGSIYTKTPSFHLPSKVRLWPNDLSLEEDPPNNL